MTSWKLETPKAKTAVGWLIIDYQYVIKLHKLFLVYILDVSSIFVKHAFSWLQKFCLFFFFLCLNEMISTAKTATFIWHQSVGIDVPLCCSGNHKSSGFQSRLSGTNHKICDEDFFCKGFQAWLNKSAVCWDLTNLMNTRDPRQLTAAN